MHHSDLLDWYPAGNYFCLFTQLFRTPSNPAVYKAEHRQKSPVFLTESKRLRRLIPLHSTETFSSTVDQLVHSVQHRR